MSQQPGLVAIVYPNYFNSPHFRGLVSNCFTFMTGFDDTFMGSLGVKALRPEDLEWTSLRTKEGWVSAVNQYFNPHLPEPQPGSTVARYGRCFLDHCCNCYHDYQTLGCAYAGLHWIPPSVRALCFPLIEGASDYHWAVEHGPYWLEQACHGGPINVWSSLNEMVDSIYQRGDDKGKIYVKGSHFFFTMRIA